MLVQASRGTESSTRPAGGAVSGQAVSFSLRRVVVKVFFKAERSCDWNLLLLLLANKGDKKDF